MSRSKKTRKTGPIGAPKSSSNQSVAQDNKRKKSSGKVSGNRNSAHLVQSAEKQVRKKTTDNRLGSKAKIKLSVDKNVTAKSKDAQIKKKTFSSPKEELDFIENDKKFNALLDKQEQNQSISEEESRYVEELVERHAVLCNLLGISLEDEDEVSDIDDNDSSGDLLDRLENTEYKGF